ncbi:MAG TPA: hypothetical protein VGF67_16790 [Ktedonobacteraceae bacterium]|jgi:hypothetical protein
MQNTWIFALALLLGLLSIVGGIFYEANILLGFHPARAIAAFVVAAILLIIGGAGFALGRRKR